MRTDLTLGYSTCPNDTLIFYGLAHQRVDCRELSYRTTLADVEQLNQHARRGLLDVTKLSFSALGRVLDTYGLLPTGAALGRGCGPLVVARPGTRLDKISRAPVAVPGEMTTAALLLGLFSPACPPMVSMPFDQIMPAVRDRRVAAGVIIHEGRFTYERYGLTCLLDLGKWWEETTGSAIPLGGIAVRRDLPDEIIEKVAHSIGDSVRFGREHPEDAMAYVRAHAREMDETVIARHIELYVNSFTQQMDAEGVRAVTTLFERARARGLMPDCARPIFASPGKDAQPASGG